MANEIDDAIAVADNGVKLGLNAFFNGLFQLIAIDPVGIVVDKFTQILIRRDDVMARCKRFFDDVAASSNSDRIVDLRRSEF